MKTVSALDVRRRFGELVDQAAAGERIVIERAGQPLAAIVPLSDLAALDPDARREARLAALDDLRRMAASRRITITDPAALIGAQRRERDAQISRAARPVLPADHSSEL